MTFGYRCDTTGIPYICDIDEPQLCECGQYHTPYRCGIEPAPTQAGDAPFVVGDRLTPHMDWAAGQVINSRSQERRVYEQKGLRKKSVAEHYRQHGGDKPNMGGISYAGQSDHRSSAEKRGVFTKTGQRVV